MIPTQKFELGEHLRQVATVGSRSHQIARAITYLKTHYHGALRVEELAERVAMGTPIFHRQLPHDDGDEPAAVPEAAASQRGQTADDHRGTRRRGRRLPRGL